MSQIYCSNCGKLIPLNSNFCKFCGAPQHGKDAAFKVSDKTIEPATPHEMPIAPHKEKQKIEQADFIDHKLLGPDALIYIFIQYVFKTWFIPLMLLIGVILADFRMAAGFVLYFVVTMIIAYMVYSHFKYSIDSDGIKVEQGVLFRKRVAVPFENIQNVNLERTILERIMGLASVKVETSGYNAFSSYEKTRTDSVTQPNTGSEAFLPGLRLVEAEKVHDLMVDGVDGTHGN